MPIAAIVLAAGASTRFGSPKQDALVDGSPMLDVVLGRARDAGLSPIVAVVPPGRSVAADVIAVVNDAPEQGISRSLRLGIDAVPTAADAAVILLGDQPTLDPDVIRSLLTRTTGRPIVAAHAEGHIGPPVLVRRAAFPLVLELTGDRGLRDVLATHPDRVALVEVGAHAPDVDRPADLRRLER